jgi:hypothetical protein
MDSGYIIQGGYITPAEKSPTCFSARVPSGETPQSQAFWPQRARCLFQVC